MRRKMIRLAKYLKHFKLEITIGPFFKLMEAIFELIVPLVMASIIDIGIKQGDRGYVLQKGAIIVLLGVAGLIFALICQYSAAKASQGFGTRVRNDLYAHINTLSHAELDSIGTNSLITIITNDVNQMQLAVAMLIRLVVRAPFLVIGATVMAMLLDLKLSCIFLVVGPLIVAFMYLIMKKSIPFYKVRQKLLDKISLITRENLSGVRVVRAFSNQERQEKRFCEANEETADIAIRVGKLSALLNPATFVLVNSGIIAIIWFGGMRVNIGELSQGEVIALINYMTQISLALVVVVNLVIIFTKAAASAARINQVFDMKSSLTEGELKVEKEVESVKQTTERSDLRSTDCPLLSLQKVSFAYPNSGEYALEEIDFTLYHGEMIGIIGGTGSGKTTLVNLLLRLYDATEGEIQLNGIPLREYSFEALRSHINMVPQKSVLFFGSIRENLQMSKKDATDTEILQAIEIAQAMEFVEKLPNKLDFLIQQGGKNLSGGQRQRLAIARALVGRPKVLILDDSLSALDYATDAKLRKALREELKETTIIMVSQRAGSLQHADKIIVLEDGKIAGIGQHSELMQDCDIYQEIYRSQHNNSEEVGIRA
jgi:ABC-type multidrug transport system, ATPase and permease components